MKKKLIPSLVALYMVMLSPATSSAIEVEKIKDNCRLNFTLQESRILNVYEPIFLAPDEIDPLLEKVEETLERLLSITCENWG